jgi:hypothetical protein
MILCEHWFLDGDLHRIDGPARIWYNDNGLLKREEWFLDGRLHRMDGPAAIYYGVDTRKDWYINGIKKEKPT